MGVYVYKMTVYIWRAEETKKLGLIEEFYRDLNAFHVCLADFQGSCKAVLSSVLKCVSEEGTFLDFESHDRCFQSWYDFFHVFNVLLDWFRISYNIIQVYEASISS